MNIHVHINIIYLYIYIYIYIFIASVRALHGQRMPQYFYLPSICGRMRCDFLNINEDVLNLSHSGLIRWMKLSIHLGLKDVYHTLQRLRRGMLG